MTPKIYKAILDGIRNTTEYKLGHIELIYTSPSDNIYVVPGKGKDMMNLPSCANIGVSMGVYTSIEIFNRQPAICYF